MRVKQTLEAPPEAAAGLPGEHGGEAAPNLLRRALDPRFSGIWAILACIAGFSLAIPDTFLTETTFKTVLGDQAVTGLLALAVLLPFVAGVFDLSIASVAGFAMVLCTWLSVHSGLGILLICPLVLVASTCFGVVSGLLVSRLRTNSLVTTLGMGTVALGLTQLLTHQNTIIGDFSADFTKLGQGYLLWVPLPFVYFAVVALILYLCLEHAPVGRRLQAVGGNPIASRLAGIRTERIEFTVLTISAFISGLTGIVLAAKLGAATDSTAQGYLLPAIAALFLGATQIVDRVNVLGTVIAVLLLGVGIKGLQLLGAEIWVVQFFNGAVLVFAVTIAAGGVNRLK
ncbi:MAG TPA: ABC transporter permease [Solirubrobacterales bacterium]|nr:ABC transporter permease [Solirubrobacterales bacterium]